MRRIKRKCVKEGRDRLKESSDQQQHSVEESASTEISRSRKYGSKRQQTTNTTVTTKRAEIEDEKWRLKLAELKEHRAKHNSFTVQRKHNASLEHWIWKQRNTWRKNELSEERRNLLESIGFFDEFKMLTGDAKWMQQFKQLKDYQVNHGHCIVNRKHTLSLNKWVWWQNKFSKENEIPQHRRDLLKSIGFFDQNESAVAAQSPRGSFIDLTISNKDEKIPVQKACRRMSLIDRTLFLEDAVGLTPKSNRNLCSRVTLLEKELFVNVKKGTITERINSLEKEVE